MSHEIPIGHNGEWLVSLEQKKQLLEMGIDNIEQSGLYLLQSWLYRPLIGPLGYWRLNNIDISNSKVDWNIYKRVFRKRNIGF